MAEASGRRLEGRARLRAAAADPGVGLGGQVVSRGRIYGLDGALLEGEDSIPGGWAPTQHRKAEWRETGSAGVGDTYLRSPPLLRGPSGQEHGRPGSRVLGTSDPAASASRLGSPNGHGGTEANLRRHARPCLALTAAACAPRARGRAPWRLDDRRASVRPSAPRLSVPSCRCFCPCPAGGSEPLSCHSPGSDVKHAQRPKRPGACSRPGVKPGFWERRRIANGEEPGLGRG